MLPLLRILQWVVSHALSLAAGASAVIGEEDVLILHVANTKGVHAPLEEAVLAAAQPEVLLAAGSVVEVDLQRTAGEDLDSAQEAVVAKTWIHAVVLPIDRRVCRRPELLLMSPQAVRDENTVGISLDAPIMLQERALLTHLLEHVDEHVRVHQRGGAGVPARAVRLPRVVHVMSVACEDASFVRLGEVHQCDLRGVRQDRHEAVKRGPGNLGIFAGRLHLVLRATSAQDLPIPTGWERDLCGHPRGRLHRLHAA
mmetsp:Transcript_38014/g.95473  ORF Transcript_38014/g.95473 Transcript_38014/m.95473 type:complete len:255 (+) Transcript_38014:200-964(+)